MGTVVASTRIDQSGLDFESIYREAAGDASHIPWSDGLANPALVAWLDVVAPSIVRCGARVAVVGCGLGEDARELVQRGYDVTAFDISSTAIEWARRLDPANSECYVQADLFDPPARWRHRFDLVVEIYTIQALPPTTRPSTMAALGGLVSLHGHLLVICRGAETPVGEDDGPPWALTRGELLDLASSAGLGPAGNVDEFTDDAGTARIRGLFGRTTS
jgi:SAM-dependent methyltransferase